jgi:hypothetical protein
VLFDAFPGYLSGYRILVNAQSERRRPAVTLGLPADISVWDLMDEWERRMDTVTPLPVSMVPDDPHRNGASLLRIKIDDGRDGA